MPFHPRAARARGAAYLIQDRMVGNGFGLVTVRHARQAQLRSAPLEVISQQGRWLIESVIAWAIGQRPGAQAGRGKEDPKCSHDIGRRESRHHPLDNDGQGQQVYEQARTAMLAERHPYSI